MSTRLSGPSFASQAVHPYLESPKYGTFLPLSVQSRPPSAPLRPPLPAEYAPPDCTEVAAPSSMCSPERPSCPGCTEEERSSSPHPPRQPRQQTQRLFQDAPGCHGIPRTMEGMSSVCRGKDIHYIRGISLV